MKLDTPICFQNLDFRYLVNWPNLDILFHEIPKNGSTSIKHWLMMADRGRERAREYRPNPRKWRKIYPECYVYREQAIPERTFSLLVVRDPVARIKSAYVYVFRQHMKRDAAFSLFLKDRLLRLLDTDYEKIRMNHFRPQIAFVPEDVLDRENVIVLHIEHLTSAKRVLETRMGRELPGDVEHKNPAPYQGFEIDLPDEEIEAFLRDMMPEEFAFYERASQIAAEQRA